MHELAALSALYEATRAIGLREDLGELVDEVLEQAQALVGFEHCALLLLEPERGELRAERVRGFGEESARVGGIVLTLDQGLCGWVARHRVPVRVPDVRRDPRYVPGLAGARSCMVVPLLVRNQLVGVLDVEAHREDAFREAHERLLTVFGTQAALAIEASRSREKLALEVRRLQALHRIGQLAALPKDVGSLLDDMLALTAEVLPRGYFSILLLDPAGAALHVRASRGPFVSGSGYAIRLGEGITGRCAQEGRPVIVDDVSADPSYLPGVPDARSEVAVPLVVDGRVLGVLNAESPELRAYGVEDVRTLSVIGQQAAVVLRAAELHEELRRHAATDPLTGLANRRQFIMQLEEHLRRLRRYPESLAVAFLDLDDFKPLNDRHGHNRGDRALQAVAGAMRAWVRETDAVARLGGDEFAAILLHTDQAGAWQAVERLRESVSELDVRGADGQPVPIRLSAGLAVYPGDGSTAETLLGRADAALYEAKRAGKNRVTMAAPAPEA
jgi:diguanylate cyclase (GGDEF)-like protein